MDPGTAVIHALVREFRIIRQANLATCARASSCDRAHACAFWRFGKKLPWERHAGEALSEKIGYNGSALMCALSRTSSWISLDSLSLSYPAEPHIFCLCTAFHPISCLHKQKNKNVQQTQCTRPLQSLSFVSCPFYSARVCHCTG